MKKASDILLLIATISIIVFTLLSFNTEDGCTGIKYQSIAFALIFPIRIMAEYTRKGSDFNRVSMILGGIATVIVAVFGSMYIIAELIKCDEMAACWVMAVFVAITSFWGIYLEYKRRWK